MRAKAAPKPATVWQSPSFAPLSGKAPRHGGVARPDGPSSGRAAARSFGRTLLPRAPPRSGGPDLRALPLPYSRSTQPYTPAQAKPRPLMGRNGSQDARGGSSPDPTLASKNRRRRAFRRQRQKLEAGGEAGPAAQRFSARPRHWDGVGAVRTIGSDSERVDR